MQPWRMDSRHLCLPDSLRQDIEASDTTIPGDWCWTHLYEAPHVRVERWHKPGTAGWIVKRVDGAARVSRELAVHRAMADTGLLRAAIVAWREDENGVLVYADEGLKPVRWNRRTALAVIREMVRIHQTRPEAVGTALASLGCEPRSHTPHWPRLVEEMLAGDPAAVVRRWAERLGMHPSLRPEARLLAALERDPAYPLRSAREVLCHGDLHPGNVLWDRSRRRPAVIDWEWVHVDYEYFDLFQWLDATSPAAPRTVPCHRLWALRAYATVRQAPVAGAPLRRWMRGYLAFAFAHLVWILQRIDGDWEQRRFPQRALWRQVQETVAGLRQVSWQWSRLGPGAGPG
ncbi:aminoglycoside phosphotransferase family protein [Alicyclobacillus macrosporangiidus]|uniref:aminoglycoside phosphotransferase family protein n=1 Tax=Alicyclobacillus macrosporangiidus TaxID=392015 RepID=UPI0004979E99|nr:aminoglycoside phosphotransferase family protein [Alicyclobacillus macrosporangiidus]